MEASLWGEKELRPLKKKRERIGVFWGVSPICTVRVGIVAMSFQVKASRVVPVDITSQQEEKRHKKDRTVLGTIRSMFNLGNFSDLSYIFRLVSLSLYYGTLGNKLELGNFFLFVRGDWQLA